MGALFLGMIGKPEKTSISKP